MPDNSQSPDLQEMLNRGRAALNDARTDQAIEIFAAVLARDPNNYTARTGMGAALVTIGRAKEALDHLKHAVALRPRSPSALTNLGRAYHAVGEFQVADDLFRQALQIDPAYENARQAQDALAKDRTEALAAGRAAHPSSGPTTDDRRIAAEAALAGGAHAARMRAEAVRGMRTPIIIGSVVLGAVVVYMIVLLATHFGISGQRMETYRAKTGEFEIDVPKGWAVKVPGAREIGLEAEGTTVRFIPGGLTTPRVRFRIVVVPVRTDVTLEGLAEFAGYLDRDEDAEQRVGRGEFGGPRYPIDSQTETTLGGAPAMEFVLRDDTVKEGGPRWVYQTMAIHAGKLYSVRFEGLDKDYKKLIDVIRKSAATFKITTPTMSEMSG
jgi:hypothetical protein